MDRSSPGLVVDERKLTERSSILELANFNEPFEFLVFFDFLEILFFLFC